MRKLSTILALNIGSLFISYYLTLVANVSMRCVLVFVQSF